MRDIVVMGASAGGVAALSRVVAGLPAGWPASLFIVMHISAQARPSLHQILGRAGPLPALLAEDGMPIQPGCVVVARPDHHLLLQPGRIAVVRGPRENRHRPSIDPLFRSAAWSYGPRVAGVVLTGGLDDGAAGLWAVKSCGGTTIVQDPAEAEHPEMPVAALATNGADRRLALAQIAPELVRLAALPAPAGAAPAPPASLALEGQFAAGQGSTDAAAMAALGRLSPFTCPGCGGALWELDESGALRYRCHTGHGFSADALLQGQADVVEESLYSALRAVQEKMAALRRLAERWPDELPAVKSQYQERAQQLERTAEVLRTLLAGMPIR